jgi:hypothetical protein
MVDYTKFSIQLCLWKSRCDPVCIYTCMYCSLEQLILIFYFQTMLMGPNDAPRSNQPQKPQNITRERAQCADHFHKVQLQSLLKYMHTQYNFDAL